MPVVLRCFVTAKRFPRYAQGEQSPISVVRAPAASAEIFSRNTFESGFFKGMRAQVVPRESMLSKTSG